MNSSFACISTLIKSNIGRQTLINSLNKVSSQSLHYSLKLTNIYVGNCNKKKSDLIEMITYGCMNDKLKSRIIEDISISKAHSILQKKHITIKSLPRHGNLGLHKKDVKPYVEGNKMSIKRND